MRFSRQSSRILARALGISLTVGVLLLSAACGQKGPLYHPDEKAQEVAAPGDATGNGKKKSTPVFPAPQSQKKDRPAATTPNESATQPPVVDPDRPAPAPPPPGGN